MVATSPKTTTETDAPAASPAPATPAPSGGRAGESGDPTVQRLLAMRDGHLMNRDAIDPPVVDESGLEAVDAAIADVDDELAELGYPQEPPTER